MTQAQPHAPDCRQFPLPLERRSDLEAFQVYVHPGSGEDDQPTIRWSMKGILICLSPVAHNKHGTTYAHRCWRNRRERAGNILAEFSTPDDAVRDSIKAAKARASNNTDDGQHAGADGAHHIEHQTCTAEALLLLLVHWAFDSKKLDGRGRALHLLQDFLQSQLSNRTHSLSVDRFFFTMLSDLDCSDIQARGAGGHCCPTAQVGDTTYCAGGGSSLATGGDMVAQPLQAQGCV